MLLSEDSLPSLGYVFQRAAAFGFRVKWLPRAADPSDPNPWAEQLSPDVGLVLLTHVHSNTRVQIPVKDIAAVARQQGVVTVVDTAQSHGIVPIDLRDWPVDFVVGSSVKWLCGGPGACFLWANPDILERTQPTDVGWFSHEAPFEFDIHNFRFAGDALRFWGGTPSILPFVALAHSIGVINSIGVNAVRAHNLKLSDRIMAAVDEAMLVSQETRTKGAAPWCSIPGTARK